MYIVIYVEKGEGFRNREYNWYYVHTYCNGISTFRKVTKKCAEDMAKKLMKMANVNYNMETNAFDGSLYTKSYKVTRYRA